MKNLIKLLALLILISALGACRNSGGDNNMETDPDIMCGGVVDRSYDAPKVIESKDLTAIDTEFFYTENYGNRHDALLKIKLARNEKGELILSEENRYNVSAKVGDEVLSGAQELIDKFKLSELNGTDRYRSGLPNPYSPIYFKAEYASGESIYFCVNGNAEEAWCNELAAYFLDVFEAYGETSVLPPAESLQIVEFGVEYFDGDLGREYSSITMPDGEINLRKFQWDYAGDEDELEEYIDVPENFYSELESFLKDLGIQALINGDYVAPFEEKNPGVPGFNIFIKHADLSYDLGSIEGDEITPELLEKINAILDFANKYFEQ